MLTEHLEQAAALERVLNSPGAFLGTKVELVQSVLTCCSDLLLWGGANEALSLLDQFRDSDVEREPRTRLSLVVMRLRALVQLQRDHEVLEIAERTLVERESYPPTCGAEIFMVRILEGQSLWHLNRTEESLRKLNQIRTELLTLPCQVASAACSAAI